MSSKMILDKSYMFDFKLIKKEFKIHSKFKTYYKLK